MEYRSPYPTIAFVILIDGIEYETHTHKNTSTASQGEKLLYKIATLQMKYLQFVHIVV